jgi:hypothetical protein
MDKERKQNWEFFSILLNGLLKMASSKAAGSEKPEAYESVRRRGLATENAAGGHFQQP